MTRWAVPTWRTKTKSKGLESNDLSRWRNPDTELRILILDWLEQEPIGDQFVTYDRSVRLVWNYVRRIGVRSVLRKIRSRASESGRNSRIFGIGVGQIVETQNHSAWRVGETVLFLATSHVDSESTVVVQPEFVSTIPTSEIGDMTQQAQPPGWLADLREYQGWSPFSGEQVDRTVLQSHRRRIAESVRRAPTGSVSSSRKVSDRREVPKQQSTKPSAVLFGLGNYAKTMILPNVKPYLSVDRIHEIDPSHFEFLGRNQRIALDTSPHPRSEHEFDAWLIAGYHHMHADLAIAALKQGSYAVVEKPLATTVSQLDAFTEVVNSMDDSRFFLCFHKRYARFNKYLQSDLAAEASSPIDMHCIVFEIPLPQHHWYNWPNSRSRLTSNGCHWLDYFLFVNDYARVIDMRKWSTRGSDLVVQVGLENGAQLSLSLTDTGSKRLGVRDYIELRHANTTVKIVDGSKYEAENSRKVLRKARSNPLDTYRRMYRSIGRGVRQQDPGDDRTSLSSTRLTLELEDL